MDIFVRGLPSDATQKEVRDFFSVPFSACGITHYHCEKIFGKAFANITVLDANAAYLFLELYGDRQNAIGSYNKPSKSLKWGSRFVRCSKNREQPHDLDVSVRALAYEASEKARKAAQPSISHAYRQNAKLTHFAIRSLHCGNWDYVQGRLAFSSEFTTIQDGQIHFGLEEAVIVLDGAQEEQRQIHIQYAGCSNIVLGQYSDPTITFTLQNVPKFYIVSRPVTEEDALASQLNRALKLDSNRTDKKRSKARVVGIDDVHSQVAGMCFAYRITLSEHFQISDVRNLLSRNIKAPARFLLHTGVVQPQERMTRSVTRLNFELTDQNRYGRNPFPMLYQLDRLARNGILPPREVVELLPTVGKIYKSQGLEATVSALRSFIRHAPQPGPETDANELSRTAIEAILKDSAAAYSTSSKSPEDPYMLTKRYRHLNLIHKLIVTPCGVYLSGPEPEPTNRVLRKYSSHIDSFIRVVFQDEDGASVRYDPRASQQTIFHDRFKGVLDRGIIVAGRHFSFLGFSHSSLRAQSCWFMAPIFAQDINKLPGHILKELGNFSVIRVPAKCAARIGQNFTDTNATVDVNETNVRTLPMVLKNGFDFSDGVGTISYDLLARVWMVYGRKRMLTPTAIQIRYKGYKGMVSLDSRLSGERLMLRDNMKKFEASAEICNLEICGAGFKPLPMILNRQFIKILEDLAVDPSVFVDLQKLAVDRLRSTITDAHKTTTFLDNMEGSRTTGLPTLIKNLFEVGLDWRLDPFLYSVVEIALVNELRDIKYRARIPVEDGVTLYGIMDETGELAEDEIFVVEASASEGFSTRIQGKVIVTRSPALHPGDVQIVNAVDVRADSPLRDLSNVIVFSQHGSRDLPSKLSGGDLDGDLYNVIFDPRLMPPRTYPAASYPRISAAELDHPVTAKDMSDFFVTFMESDLLGMISNAHLQLADQSTMGTFDPKCIRLAGLASTAVDFSKTGIPVNMQAIPRRNRYRPDFMAPSPRFSITASGDLEFEEAEEEDRGYDEAFAGLDMEPRGFRYYESRKVLGTLFRAIDERKFLEKMRQVRQTIESSSTAADENLMRSLCSYMKRVATRYGILFEHHMDLATDIRAGYEDNLLNILYYYAPSPNQPVSEIEAFAGTILGRKSGAQGKPLRELGKTLRERFEPVVQYTIMRMVKGDSQIHGVTDLDLLYDDGGLDREVEALPRAIACLSVAVEGKGLEDRVIGELESFKYIAAGACFKELERYMVTTMGPSGLPRV